MGGIKGYVMCLIKRVIFPPRINKFYQGDEFHQSDPYDDTGHDDEFHQCDMFHH